MKERTQLPLKFPKRFFWGAASAAHQVEGGNHNQWSVWELENAKVLAETAKYQANYLPTWDEIKPEATDPNNYISGKATNHYKLYEQDFALLKKLNMNAWRFSIEWSRIEPEEGSWDAGAIEHYRTYLRRLKELNIEPIVTLWHWTVPVWFEEKGGFTKRANIKYFVRFVERVFEELGRDFRYVITLNEPEVYVAKSFFVAEWPPQVRNNWQGFWVLMNLLSAHKKIYRVAKNSGRKYKVSIAKNSAYHYAGDDAKLSQWTAQIMKWASDYFILNRIKRHLDFIGLNYYFSNRYYGYRMHNPEDLVSDVGWSMRPADIEFILKELSDRYELPIIITENGLADRDDEYRKWWLMQTLAAMHRALQGGVKLEGYLHWSLTDNFEWSSGFWPRFGLAEVDYTTSKRKLRPSAVWFGSIIKKLGS
ncbi:MAG: glycoside hydrolase family 1 protein [Candidatus Saccharimonadales bacterium]